MVNHHDNPMTDLFKVIKFDHLEYTVGDARTSMQIFKRGLGMELIGESRKETGNHSYTSFVLKTNTVKFVFTAPYLAEFKHPDNKMPNPKYDEKKALSFFSRHGCGVSSIGIEVEDAREAYKIATGRGAIGIVEPCVLSNAHDKGSVIMSEILIYNEDDKDPLHKSQTTLRFMQYDGYEGPFIPGYRAVKDPHPLNYGIQRMDHVVGNVFTMDKIISDLKNWLGFHTFAKFSKEEIQTLWTSLNSEVLASNNLRVLFPINESAEGKKESQIIEYLKAYNGPGVQHIALKSDNIFNTVGLMKTNSDCGFEFIPTPASYYKDPIIQKRMNEHLNEEEIKGVMECGILVDLDEEGVLLQVFTKPLFDRPTLFVEIIQRKCRGTNIEVPGCGGFGKGNFKALFEAIERMQAERGGLLPSTDKTSC